MEQELKRQMEAMTTPPPVPEEGAEAADAEALLQLNHGGKANSTKSETHHVTMDQMRAALEKMVDSVWVDPQSKKALGVVGSMIQQSTLSDEDPPAAPAPAPDPLGQAQENGANNLAAFEMLKGKAEESLQRLRDNEVTEKHNHDLRIQALTQAIHLAEDKKEDATKDKTRLTEEKGEAEAELVKTQETKAAAEKYLAEVSSECDKASQDWVERQKGAKEEMAAINKAKEILAARVNVFVQAKLHLRDPHQQSTRKVLSQEQKARQDLIQHFRNLGAKMKSMAMLNLVSVASEEPMDQVKGLISDLIEKLEKEAAEAANLHAFCEAEKEKNKKAKAKKTATIEKLDARLDSAISRKEELEENVATLSGEIADMEAGQAEATKIRNDEKALNTKSIADFKEAADAVADATDALKDYYGDSLLELSSNTDSKQHAPPKLGGARSDAANTILSIMDTMQQEFEKTAAEFTSSEREAAKAHAELIQANKVSKASKEAEIKGNQSEIKSLSVAIHNFKTDKKSATGELDTVLEYIEKLKPQCQGRTVPYAERKAKREAEIAGLKDALAILEKDGVSDFLQIRASLRRH